MKKSIIGYTRNENNKSVKERSKTMKVFKIAIGTYSRKGKYIPVIERIVQVIEDIPDGIISEHFKKLYIGLNVNVENIPIETICDIKNPETIKGDKHYTKEYYYVGGREYKFKQEEITMAQEYRTIKQDMVIKRSELIDMVSERIKKENPEIETLREEEISETYIRFKNISLHNTILEKYYIKQER